MLWKKRTDMISATLQHDVGYLHDRDDDAVYPEIQKHSSTQLTLSSRADFIVYVYIIIWIFSLTTFNNTL